MLNSFERYRKNTIAFSREDVEAVHTKSVCVIGCGGLGGFVAMTLARFGVGKLSLVDGDEFIPSNLNRQLFCTEGNLGKNKAIEAEKALSVVNRVYSATRGERKSLTKQAKASILSAREMEKKRKKACR